ncbi:hybrid sensor histidine kinase/response regulator [Candidatus Harpocratesius sp.]
MIIDSLRSYFESSFDGFLVIERNGKIIYINSQFLEKTGYSKFDLFQMNLIDIFPEINLHEKKNFLHSFDLEQDFLSQYLSNMQKSREFKEVSIKTKINKRSSYIKVKINVCEILWENEKKYLICIRFNPFINENKQISEITTKEVLKYLDIVGVIILELDSMGRIKLLNKFGQNLLGVTENEIIGLSWFDHFLPKNEATTTRDVFYRLMKNEIEPVKYHTNSILTKNKELRTIKWHNSIIRNSEGKIIGTLSSGMDITNLLEIQHNLEKSCEFLRITLNSSPNAITTTDLNGIIINCNPATVELHRANSEHDVIGLNSLDLIDEKDQDLAIHNMEKILKTGNLKNAFYTLKRFDGTTFPGEISASVIYDSKKKPIGFVAITRDLTHWLKMEEIQLQNQKYEALSLMASGIAHDLNNALMIIGGNLNLIKEELDSPSIREMLEDVENAINNAKHTINSLMFYDKNTFSNKEVNDINQIIHSAVKFVSHGTSCIFTYDLNKKLPLVICNKSQISQVLINILINAEQSMLNGGEIHIKSYIIPADEIIKKYSTKIEKIQDYVAISITDQGEGIKPEIASRIFDPYFSTKSTGTGIGLPTSLSIIKKHEGYLFFTSSLEFGTTFFILLPLNSNVNIKRKKILPDKKEKIFPSKRILIMEDNNKIQKIILKMMKTLEIAANIVSNSKSCIEAYQIAMNKKEPFDLVILDNIIIGGITGKETLKELQKIDPSVKAVISSGTLIPNFADFGFIGQIQKPYVLEKLRDLFNQTL